jgi:hypothetical protein
MLFALRERISLMTQYTAEQKARLMELPEDVVVATMLADTSGPIGELRERFAGMKAIGDTQQVYPHNALIQSIPRNTYLKQAVAELIPTTEQDRDSSRMLVQQRIDEACSLLSNDAEAQEFKRFLVNIAQKVAEAAGSGWSGGGTQKVSQAEAEYIQALKNRLGVA